MPWRYGIVKFRSEKDPNFRFYGVGELFYTDDPLAPYACSQEQILLTAMQMKIQMMKLGRVFFGH